LNVEMDEIIKKQRDLGLARTAFPRPPNGVYCIDTTLRDPMKNEGKEYVAKTTCRTY
jgi:hypothetical protein